MHICQFKTLINGVLSCGKYGHLITTHGCPYCPDRPYSGSSDKQSLNKSSKSSLKLK